MRLCAVVLPILLFAQARLAVPSNPAIDGTWMWTGSAGWQRSTIHLSANGEKLTGTLTMGPGRSPADRSGEDWEHFFEPAVFAISDGVVKGGHLSFTQVSPSASAAANPGLRGGGSQSGRAKRERWLYSGVVDGDRLALTREIPAQTGDPFAIGYHKTTVVFTRNNAAAASQVESVRGAGYRQLARFIDVAVSDSRGEPVLDLSAEDFVVSDNGIERAVSRVDLPTTPLNILLMFDHNLTWLQDDRSPVRSVSRAWNALLLSSTKFLNTLRSQDRFAVGLFEDKPVLSAKWRRRSDGSSTLALSSVMDPPGGQKDLYGAIDWAVAQFAGAMDRKVAVVFTDGRDGRLSPRWIRDEKGREVLDPWFGVDDVGEQAEFEKTLLNVAQSGIRFYFIAVNTDQDPEFGPAIIDRRISGLYPGTSDGIARYLSQVRSRLERIADASGGRVLYGNTAPDAVALYSELNDELAIGRTYTLELAAGSQSEMSQHAVEVQLRRPGLRLTRLQPESQSR